MPLPTALLFTFATGLLSALAGRAEVKLSPKHALLTRAFGAFMLFLCCVLVPVTVYFYVFHGDWFLLYLVDCALIPSAIALLGFIAQTLIGVAGFSLAASFLRTQRETLAAVLAGLAILLGALVPGLLRERLSVVGTYAQFDRSFGLTDFSQSPLFLGVIAMNAIALIGFTFLLGRVWFGERR